MPCPPTFEEQQMSRIDACSAIASLAITAGSKHLGASLALVEKLIERGASPVPDLDACLTFARSFVERGLPTYEGPRATVEGWPTDEDLRREDARLAFEEDLAARFELCLCVFGTVTACFVRDHGNSPDLANEVEVETARHRAHREEERGTWVMKLNSERGAWRHNPEMVALIDARLERIAAVTSERLCTDRRCTD